MKSLTIQQSRVEMIDDENINELEKKYREIVDNFYHELLLRPADKIGLDYFTSVLMNKTATVEEVKKLILESEEAKNIQSFTHYTAQYWNDLDRVNRYLNKLSTGNEETTWLHHLVSFFKQHIPFGKVLIVGCGNGWLERQLYDLGIGLHFDAFDISENYLETARQQKGNRDIHYFKSDINKMDDVENDKYDAVFNYAILHHATEVEEAMLKLSRVLKIDGLMFNWEYVGPSRNQYDDEHLAIMQETMARLPERFRSRHALRPPIENFRVEPTEAIHSDLIRPIFGRFFDIIYERNLNGGIAYQILWNNINEFRKNDREAADALDFLLRKDLEYTELRKVPVLFWYGVGTPKCE